MRFYTGFLLLFILHSISASAQSDSTEANRLFSEASTLHSDGDYGKAAEVFETAAVQYEVAGIETRQAEALLRAGDNWIRDTKFDLGEARTEEAEALLETIADPSPELSGRAFMNRGLLALYANKAAVAKDAYQQAITFLLQAKETEHLLSTSYNDLGVVAGMNGNYQEELGWYEKALEIQIRLYGEKDVEVAGTYNNIGTAYYRLGDYAAMDNYLRKAETVMISSLGERHPYMATVYNNIAFSSQLMENYEETIRYYKKALNIHGLTREEKHSLVSVTYNNLAETYGKMGDLKQQLAYHQKALSLRLSVLGRLHTDVAVSYQNLGHVYRKLGQPEKEFDAFSEALSIKKEIYGERHPEVAKTYLSFSELFRDRGNIDSAYHFLQKSYAANSLQYSAETNQQLPPLDEAFSYPFLLEQLMVHGETQEAVAKASGKQSDWRKAMEIWIHADSLVWQRRSGIIDPNGPIYLGRESRLVYEGGIRCAANLLEEEWSETTADALLLFLVRSRAGQLWEAWQSAPVANAFGLASTALDEERLLNETIQMAEQRSRQVLADSGRNSPAFVQASDTVFEARKNWEIFIRKLDQQYPGYVSQRYQRPRITWKRFREELNQDIAIAFFITEGELYRFGFQQDNIHVSHSPRNAQLNEPFMELLQVLQSGKEYETDSYQAAASQLMNEILMPVLWELSAGPETDVIFIPDGVLGYLPMEALGTMEDEQFTYFSDDQPIRYQYNLIRNTTTAEEPRLVFAGFAPSYEGEKTTDSRSEFAPLTHNEQEVETALDMIRDGGIWKGDDATESRFKQVAPDAKILHLAMHGRLNDSQPSASFLAFAGDDEEDGRLYAYEISAMKLNADLAVLSACQTGSGSIQQGEGIMSLARAFQEAGCRSVLMSLWAVNDEATYEFMTRFYGFWNQGYPSSQALVKTRKAMQVETRFREPHYWAGFVLMGDSLPVPGSKSRWPWMLGGFVMALLAFILYSRRRAKAA